MIAKTPFIVSVSQNSALSEDQMFFPPQHFISQARENEQHAQL